MIFSGKLYPIVGQKMISIPYPSLHWLETIRISAPPTHIACIPPPPRLFSELSLNTTSCHKRSQKNVLNLITPWQRKPNCSLPRETNCTVQPSINGHPRKRTALLYTDTVFKLPFLPVLLLFSYGNNSRKWTALLHYSRGRPLTRELTAFSISSF